MAGQSAEQFRHGRITFEQQKAQEQLAQSMKPKPKSKPRTKSTINVDCDFVPTDADLKTIKEMFEGVRGDANSVPPPHDTLVVTIPIWSILTVAVLTFALIKYLRK